MITYLPFIFLGLISGSFLNVLIYRLPLKKSFIFSRSHCPNCKSKIPLYRNIPIISYLIQFGKCHNCSNKISLQYPFVESLSAFFWYWGAANLLSYDAVLFILITNILIVISFIDIKTMEINIYLVLLSIIFLFVYGLFVSENTSNMLYGSIVGCGYLGFVFLLTSFIFKKQTMGLGDLQLIIVLGAWIGPGNILVSIFLASLFGVIFLVIANVINKHNKITHLPFAPFLSLSSIITYMMNIDIFNYLIGY